MEIFEIVYKANQERTIESKLNSIKERWKFDVLNLQTLLNSRFVDVAEWDKNLNLIGNCMKQLLTVQQNCMYLEAIFIGSGDIRIQKHDFSYFGVCENFQLSDIFHSFGDKCHNLYQNLTEIMRIRSRNF